jgi:hypothetical protein
MLSEALAIDVNHQDRDALPAPLLQLLELLAAGLDRLAADGTARDAYRLRHLGQDLLIFPRRNTAQQRAQHMLAESPICAEHFIGGNLHFSFRFVAKAWSLHSHLAVCQLDAAGL